MERNDRIDKVQKGDELKPGVLKLVKVYIATRRKISVGDKMAGRHGNKGVVSKILLGEDMPYLDDGTSVDMAPNPLSFPSRMNVGSDFGDSSEVGSRETGNLGSHASF